MKRNLNLLKNINLINQYKLNKFNFIYQANIDKQNIKSNIYSNYNKCFFSTSNNSNSLIDTDVIIIGGGVVGLSIANGLKSANITDNIILIDQSNDILDLNNYKYKKDRIPEIRNVSLTSNSVNYFKAINTFQNLDERILTYVKEMQIWENKGSSFMNIKSDKFENNYISCMIELNNLLCSLQNSKHMNGIKKINIKLSSNNFDIKNNKDYCLFTIKDNIDNKLNSNYISSTTYRTKLLIISDGPKSLVRTKLNIPVTGYDYNETGLVCTLKANKNNFVSFQRFLHEGIFALLPMYDNYFSIVSSMPKEINEKLKNLKDEEFINFVNNLLHSRSNINSKSFNSITSLLDNLNYLNPFLNNNNNFCNPPIIESVISPRLTFPLQVQYVDSNVPKLNNTTNIIVVGDSAHAIHPMAGQGLNLGIADSALLINALAIGKKEGKRINNSEILIDKFEFKANINTKSMIMGQEIIKGFYKSNNNLFSGLRNLGIGILNSSNSLKKVLTGLANGELVYPKIYEWKK